MVKNWKPENWEEIKAKSIKALIANKDKAYPPIYTQGEIFEAGADAILEALYQEIGHKPVWFGKTDSGDILIYMTIPDK